MPFDATVITVTEFSALMVKGGRRRRTEEGGIACAASS